MSARESLEQACKDYYKVLTHDLRPPIQGGEPLWADGGGYPIRLPAVVLDMSAGMCDQGWCACGGPHEALKIAGLWPDGWPSRLFAVRSESEWLERGCGLRTAGPLIVEREMLVTDGILARLHEPMAGGLSMEALVCEVQAWRVALGRPERDPAAVEAGLRAALDTRGLRGWELRRFECAQDAWRSWAARDAKPAWDSWYTLGAAGTWDTWRVDPSWYGTDVWYLSEPGYTWAAHSASDALAMYVDRSRRGAPGDPYALTTGLRDAYRAGLALAVPAGSTELGWAMAR